MLLYSLKHLVFYLQVSEPEECKGIDLQEGLWKAEQAEDSSEQQQCHWGGLPSFVVAFCWYMRISLNLTHFFLIPACQGLGNHNIICIEDLVHEIMTVGPHFKEANNFLWPFKLKAPLGGLNWRRGTTMLRVVMPGTVRTTSTSSSRGWTKLFYPVRLIF